MSPGRVTAVALLLLLCGPVVGDDRVLEIIELRHALVDDVLPPLRDLVAAGGTVTGMRDKLVIRTTPDNLAQLKEVLAALDRRLRQLRITVSQDIGNDYQWRDDSAAARIQADDVSAQVGATPPPGTAGASIGIGGSDAGVRYHTITTRGREDRANTQFVNAIEGNPAFINTGQVVPLANRQAVPTPYGAAIYDSVEYRNVGTGFYVTPRLAGDRVTLEISPYAENLARGNGGVIESRGANTVVSGRLGEWIALGGASQGARNQGSGIAYHTRGSHDSAYDVWVRVDVVD